MTNPIAADRNQRTRGKGSGDKPHLLAIDVDILPLLLRRPRRLALIHAAHGVRRALLLQQCLVQLYIPGHPAPGARS